MTQSLRPLRPYKKQALVLIRLIPPARQATFGPGSCSTIFELDLRLDDKIMMNPN